MTTNLALDLNRGETRTLTFTLTNENGTALDLSTQQGIWITFKKSQAEADAAAVWQGTEAGGDITITDATGGIISVSIPSTAFNSLTQPQSHRLFYDIKVSPASGQYTYPAAGFAVIDYRTTLST